MTSVAAPLAHPVGTTRTMIAPLQRGALIAAEQPAVICGADRLTHAQLGDRVARLIAALRAMGLRRGDRVAVVGPNCHRYLEIYLAVPAGGFVLVPLNARHTNHELGYALQDSGARVLFSAQPSPATAAAVERVVELPGGYDELLATASEPAPWADLAEHDLAGLFYTGGTTGAAKGVMLTHGNLVANAYHFMACWPFTPQTRWLVVAPMFHAAGTIAVLATLWAGGAQVLLPAFSAPAVLDAIETHGVTATLVVPTMMAALAAEQERCPRDVSSLRWLSHGSAPVGTSVLKRTHAAFPNASMLHIYGATETSPILTLLPDEQDLLDAPQAFSCGRPAVGIELEIVDPQRRPLAPREIGEVRVRGANVAAGYWNKPAETERAIGDGWYLTGDLGYLDETGHLFLVDRAKDMIVTGGENVYSIEVEEALSSHPRVAEVAVFGVPDERWGEAVHAVVVTSGAVSEQELIDHARTRIAAYKSPKAIDLRSDPLPKSGAGKILKRELREPFWRERSTRVGA